MLRTVYQLAAANYCAVLNIGSLPMSVPRNLKAIGKFSQDFAFFVDTNAMPPTDLRSSPATAHAPTLGTMQPTLSSAGCVYVI